MTIKVYVNDDYEVISENQYNELIKERLSKLNEVAITDYFTEWLDSLPYGKHYNSYDLLLADGEKRADILAIFQDWLSNTVAEEMEEEWYEREVEV